MAAGDRAMINRFANELIELSGCAGGKSQNGLILAFRRTRGNA